MRKKMIRVAVGFILLLAVSFLYHWQDKNHPLDTPAAFDDELAGAPPGTRFPDSTLEHMNAKVRTAVSKGDYALGMKIVDALSKVDSMSPEQTVSFRNTVQTMKVQMAEAALGGDTNAEKAIAYFKTTSVLGR